MTESGFYVSRELLTRRVERIEHLLSGHAGMVTRCRNHRLAFIGVHEACRLEDFFLILRRNDEKSVLVGMDKLAGPDTSAKNLDLAVPFDGMAIGVPDAESPGQSLEADTAHLVEVADAAIGDGPDASESFVHAAVDLAPESPDDIRFVQILNDDDFGPRLSPDVTAILAPGVGILPGMRRIAWFDDHGERVADHGAYFGHEVLTRFEIESLST